MKEDIDGAIINQFAICSWATSTGKRLPFPTAPRGAIHNLTFVKAPTLRFINAQPAQLMKAALWRKNHENAPSIRNEAWFPGSLE